MATGRKNLRISLAATAFSMFVTSAFAFNVSGVTIQKIHSPNVFGHVYVLISGVSNCPDNPQAYFIIPGWTDPAEPGNTYRKTMMTMIIAAHTSGKTVSVSGAQCYLNKYLLADELSINE
jgi:hypothetical protein